MRERAQSQGVRPSGVIERAIEGRVRDLGGFAVRRVLPAMDHQMVGPFIFFDQMGPAELPPSHGIDVRPHPHIGLSTLTWLFEGEILHRDSIGSIQRIRPGEVNWMTAGAGIAHSERTPEDVRATSSRLFGIQTWLALPAVDEETAPSFQHVSAPELPVIEGDGCRVVLIAGTGWNRRSPVRVFSPTLYADVSLDAGSTLMLPAEHEERALYIVAGGIEIEGQPYRAGPLLVLRPGDGIAVRATTAARLVVIGGAKMDGPRHIWWNFVSSRAERIEQAKADWKRGAFAKVIDDDAFIPLPEG